MAIIWNDERPTPGRMLPILERERERWLETAAACERLKTYLTGSFSRQDAEQCARNCRVGAEARDGLIKTVQEQVRRDRTVPAGDSVPEQYVI